MSPSGPPRWASRRTRGRGAPSRDTSRASAAPRECGRGARRRAAAVDPRGACGWRLRAVVLALAEVDVAHVASAVDEVVRRPVLIRVRVPGPEVVVERHRMLDAEVSDCPAHVAGSCSNANSGACTADDDETVPPYASYQAFTCGSSRRQLMHVYVQKFTSTTFPRRPAIVSGRSPGVFSQGRCSRTRAPGRSRRGWLLLVRAAAPGPAPASRSPARALRPLELLSTWSCTARRVAGNDGREMAVDVERDRQRRGRR